MTDKFSLFFLAILALVILGCGSSSNPDLRYVAIGASDVAGIGAEPLSRGYVFLIEDGLEEDGNDVELIPLGIPGAKTDVIVDVSLPAAIQFDPEIITVFVGANDLISGDSVGEFEASLETLLRELSGETAAFITIANLPDLTAIPRFRDSPRASVTAERVAAFNGAISRQAAENDIPVVDLFSEDLDDSFFNEEDGFHPGNEGYRVMAERFLEVIRDNYGNQ